VAVVLIPIPHLDFDPTEVAVSWKVLRRFGHDVRFATPVGQVARGDELMVTGRGLDPWGFVPGMSRFVGLGRALRADARGRQAYEEMVRAPEFGDPGALDDIDLAAFDGLLLPGGHRSRGMRLYLESPRLQAVVVDAFRRQMPVAAVCHGVLLAARSIEPQTGRSALHGHRTTALTWELEQRAWRVARVTRFWDPNYYRTYREQPGRAPGLRRAGRSLPFRPVAGRRPHLRRPIRIHGGRGRAVDRHASLDHLGRQEGARRAPWPIWFTRLAESK
jgi:putative intracellular protease/amidase